MNAVLKEKECQNSEFINLGKIANVVQFPRKEMTFTRMNSPRLMASPRGTHELEERRSVPGTTGVGGVE